jgi:hypothetical protein
LGGGQMRSHGEYNEREQDERMEFFHGVSS